MKDMLDSIGIKEFMGGLDLPEKSSNRGYESVQLIECFWTSIWIGAVSRPEIGLHELTCKRDEKIR